MVGGGHLVFDSKFGGQGKPELVIELCSSIRDDVFRESMFPVNCSLKNGSEFLCSPVFLPRFKDNSFRFLVGDN